MHPDKYEGDRIEQNSKKKSCLSKWVDHPQKYPNWDQTLSNFLNYSLFVQVLCMVNEIQFKFCLEFVIFNTIIQ